MPDQTDTAPTTVTPPKRGEFCHPHFSWLCQAGQGQCQRGEQPTPATEGDPNA